MLQGAKAMRRQGGSATSSMGAMQHSAACPCLHRRVWMGVLIDGTLRTYELLRSRLGSRLGLLGSRLGNSPLEVLLILGIPLLLDSSPRIGCIEISLALGSNIGLGSPRIGSLSLSLYHVSIVYVSCMYHVYITYVSCMIRVHDMSVFVSRAS